MWEKFFFDVPVYRLSEDRYYEDQKKYIEKNMYPGPPSHNEQKRRVYAEHSELRESFESHLQEGFGGAWDFNEIVGWIRLHFLCDQIRGEYWAVKAKRVVRTRKKEFEYKSWKLAAELEIPEEADSAAIFLLIQDYLRDCRNELQTGRYLETSRLLALGPYVNWRELVDADPNA